MKYLVYALFAILLMVISIIGCKLSSGGSKINSRLAGSCSFYAYNNKMKIKKSFAGEYFIDSNKEKTCFIITNKYPVIFIRGDNQYYFILINDDINDKKYYKYFFDLPNEMPIERISAIHQGQFQNDYLNSFFSSLAKKE